MHYHSFILGQRSCTHMRSCTPLSASANYAHCRAHISLLSGSRQRALRPPRVPISRSDKQSNRMLCHVQLLAEFSRL